MLSINNNQETVNFLIEFMRLTIMSFFFDDRYILVNFTIFELRSLIFTDYVATYLCHLYDSQTHSRSTNIYEALWNFLKAILVLISSIYISFRSCYVLYLVIKCFFLLKFN